MHAYMAGLQAASDLMWLCRLANSVAHDIHKLPFRGTVSNGEVKVEQTKMGHSPPIWFVFSGASSSSGSG